MKGYVARKGKRWYAVIYEGTDPITGKERRSSRVSNACPSKGTDTLAARCLRRVEYPYEVRASALPFLMKRGPLPSGDLRAMSGMAC